MNNEWWNAIWKAIIFLLLTYIITIVIATILAVLVSGQEFGCSHQYCIFNDSVWNCYYLNCTEQPHLIVYNNTTEVVVYNITNCTGSELVPVLESYLSNYTDIVSDIVSGSINYSQLYIEQKLAWQGCILNLNARTKAYEELLANKTKLAVNETEKWKNVARVKDDEGWTRAGVAAIVVAGILYFFKIRKMRPSYTKREPLPTRDLGYDSEAMNRDIKLRGEAESLGIDTSKLNSQQVAVELKRKKIELEKERLLKGRKKK